MYRVLLVPALFYPAAVLTAVGIAKRLKCTVTSY